MKRALLYVLIPVGFVLIVAVMLWEGRETGGPVADPSERIETDPLDASPSPVDPELTVDPDGTGEPAVPTPSGPEGRDNEVFFEEAPAPAD
ncbi:hypothetical protein [Marivita sp. GX14005]|uniref:hypothetical protein n=1 Tax=Marivita sp. GX14005 TaxID=2942276 RepID=UPI002019EDF6|nr:hypothetical protein [Marivita sp. GX14005]MCL3881878.1 hypothetical protein [Marivita sp. GX14005]